MTTARVLVVDDETLFAKAVCKRLSRAGYDCADVAYLGEAQSKLDTYQPDLILLDMRLPDGSGLDFLAALRNGKHAHAGVVVMTAFSETDDAVAAMKMGALDYLRKPVDLDKLLATLESAHRRIALNKHRPLSRQPDDQLSEAPELIGQSPAIARVREHIAHIGRLSSQTHGAPPTVLVLGETGTGKDLAARCLHAASARHDRPFVHVDCAALPKDLIEAELFGHEKGAYTGAHDARAGLIEAAQEGTLFLDEIAEMPLALQTKLLAVLERRVLRRVGSSREQPVAAWFIAATHRDLASMVGQGDFRADLYYRLKVLTLDLAPLRERGDDVLLLAQRAAERTALRYGLPEPRFGDDALAALRNYRWPGNVRELNHLIERALLLSSGAPLNAAALMLDSGDDADKQHEPHATPYDTTLESAEAALIRRALDKNSGNVSAAARALGVTRMTLRYRMQKYGIDPPRQ